MWPQKTVQGSFEFPENALEHLELLLAQPCVRGLLEDTDASSFGAKVAAFCDILRGLSESSGALREQRDKALHLLSREFLTEGPALSIPPAFAVWVHMLTGKKLFFWLPEKSETTFGALSEMIAEEEGRSRESIRLIFAGRSNTDDLTLASRNVKNGALVYCMFKTHY